MADDDVARLQQATANMQLDETQSTFAKALEQSSFNIFSDVKDLGFYKWCPEGSYKDPEDLVAADFLGCLPDNFQLPVVQDVQTLNEKLPLKFEKAKGPVHLYKFPYDDTFLTPMHVAVQRDGFDLNEIDFVMGGSPLHMLAHAAPPGKSSSRRPGDKQKQFIACLVPGTNIVEVKWHEDYEINLSDKRYQLRRFVTEGNVKGEADKDSFGHVHLMTIGGRFKVLFCGETDAVDSNGDLVKIKSGDAMYWDSRLAFQMISGGFAKMFGGKKEGDSLEKVMDYALPAVLRRYCPRHAVSFFEENILTSLKRLREFADEGLFEEGKASYQVSFDKSDIVLERLVNRQSHYPALDVVSEMLRKRH